MHTLSFWERESFVEEYDLIIVGAGITGLSLALKYREMDPKASVLVLERSHLPAGASTRNAGFACIGSITEHLADLEKSGEQELKQRIKRRYEGLKMLLDALGGEQAGYRQTGGCELFTEREKFESAAGEISRFNKWMRELTGEEDVYARDELNGYPVIHNRLEGHLHPGKMMVGLIELAKSKHIEIRWNCNATHIERDGGVILDDGYELHAGRVAVAVNGFTDWLVPDLDIRPARGYLLLTEKLENLRWRGTFHYDRGYVYFRDVGDRLLLGGARNRDRDTEETDRFGINPNIRDYLAEFAGEILHLGGNWSIQQEWSGIMGFTETKTPVIRKIHEKLFVAGGLSGMGIAIGMQVGKEAAALVYEG